MVDMMFEACMTYEPGVLEHDDFPQTDEPVCLLGKKYSSLHDLEELRADVRSLLWFTYRRGFVPVGETGKTTDKGWGCMLRCGQMVLGQALVRRHLGRDWIWKPETSDSTYLRILQLFEDRKGATYSVHQIALMGASEGKEVGEWFGPNTVAQALRKLAVYDDWSSVVIHVALDNTVIIDDVKTLCKPGLNGPNHDLNCSGHTKSWIKSRQPELDWRPLVLIVPLRLGLSEINPVYIRGLQTCFTFTQSIGVIGGKPNHALYFIGFVGNEIVYLDPHTTQEAVLVEDKEQEQERLADESYHCQFASRMDIREIDPSVAVCFFCKTEADLDNLCYLIQKFIVHSEKQPLFELCKERPLHWPPIEDIEMEEAAACSLGFENVERHFDTSDEEFEIVGFTS